METDLRKVKQDEQKNLESILAEEKSMWRQKTWPQKMSRKLKDKIVRSHKFRNNNFVAREDGRERPKIVVYSCITGGYDKVAVPVHTFQNIDYVLFTDGNIKSDKWTIRAIPEEYKQETPALTNRYIKMHPHEVFAKDSYEYSIYIDGNIKVVGDLTPMAYAVSELGLAMHRHSMREDIKKEVYACISQKKGNRKKLIQQFKRYKRAGFPKKYGMLECNVIAAALGNQCAEKILKAWWEEFIKSGSMRDQIALPYVLWKMGYKIENVGNLGYNVYRNPKLRKVDHLI